MSDISVTASAVLAGSDSVQERRLAGETITAGQAVYKDSDTGRFKLSDANGAAALREVYGIALNGASDGQPLSVHKSGDLTMNAVLSPNVAYYLSSTPGGICPLADVGTGEYMGFIGVTISPTVLRCRPINTGVSN